MKTIDFEGCPCSGKNMSTLVGPWILLILYDRAGAHGYEIQKLILNRLQELEIGFNLAGLYRHLNAMEKRGMLTSTGETREPGPAKRKYYLTAAGKECLWRWVGTLGIHLTLIGKFMEQARQIFPEAILPEVVIAQTDPNGAGER